MPLLTERELSSWYRTGYLVIPHIVVSRSPGAAELDTLAAIACGLLGEQAIATWAGDACGQLGPARCRAHVATLHGLPDLVDGLLVCLLHLGPHSAGHHLIEVAPSVHRERLPHDSRGALDPTVAALLAWQPVPLRRGDLLTLHAGTPHRCATAHANERCPILLTGHVARYVLDQIVLSTGPPTGATDARTADRPSPLSLPAAQPSPLVPSDPSHGRWGPNPTAGTTAADSTNATSQQRVDHGRHTPT